MKIQSYILIGLLVFITGCGTVSGFFGKNSNKVQKQSDKIQMVEDKQSTLNLDKMNQVSQLSFGVNKSIDYITNKEPAVIVTKELNDRIQTISGLPTLEQQAAMTQLVQDLVSNNIAGKVELANKDKELSSLQDEETLLVKQKQTEIDNALQLSKDTALKADTTQNELSSYQSYWGLGGVVMGIKSFVVHCFWYGLIFLLLFLVLRALAFTNPFAAIIFGILQSIGATIIHLIELAIPQSISTITDTKNNLINVSDAINKAIETPIPPAK